MLRKGLPTGLSALALLAALAACAPAATPMAAATQMQPLSASAQGVRNRVMQSALEYNTSGQPAVWTLPGDARGSVVPLATVPTAENGWCRDYEERIATTDGRQDLVGVACRDGRERWRVIETRPVMASG